MKRIGLLFVVLSLILTLNGCSEDTSPLGQQEDITTTSTTEEAVPQITVEPITLNEYISEYNSKLRKAMYVYVNTDATDSDFVSAAKIIINKYLKNPSTAQYNEAKVHEKDEYGRAIVYLDVSAQNSFGGWVRSNYYVCIQGINTDDTFTYNPGVSYIEDKNDYDILVMLNDFGEHPDEDEIKEFIFSEDDFVKENTLFISPAQDVDCYKAVRDWGVHYVYIDTKTHCLVASQFLISDLKFKSDYEKIIPASFAVMANTVSTSAELNIKNVFDFNDIKPVDRSTYYNAGFVYDCFENHNDVSIAATIVDEDRYLSEIYWTANNKEQYYELSGDKYAIDGDYDNAITYYEQGMISGDKLYDAYYNKAEQSLANGEYDVAGAYFGYAGSYKDAAIRSLEVYYSAGNAAVKENDYISAINNYSLAGDYSDAKTKYKEYCFKQGELYANDKKYTEAITCFAEAADYNGASDKYKEISYLYAEQELMLGNVENASVFFEKAGDYSDASTRIQRYYYELGASALNSNDFLNAADNFILAGEYSDAKTMELECYYCYGKQQFGLNYISDAIKYFSKCRGYKDTDEILLSYYYGEAIFAFDSFLDAFASDDNYSISQWYDQATKYCN